MKRQNGMTLLESMLALTILVIIAVAFVKLLAPNIGFFKKAEGRLQGNSEARKTMETVRRLLGNGKASTVSILTPTNTAPPNSQISFESLDGFSYVISWVAPNSVQVQRTPTPPAAGTTVTNIIANNVTGLMFTLDFRDPAVINVSLQVDIPLDQSGTGTSVYTILQPNQSIRMAASQ
jgi:prepilin-type N-terminal cleavage/methylation domain-containing protein